MWLSGIWAAAGIYAVLKILDPAELAGLPWFELIAIMAFWSFVIVLTNHAFLSGRWSFQRWRDWAPYTIGVTACLAIGYLAAHSLRYAVVWLILLCGGHLMLVGFLGRRVLAVSIGVTSLTLWLSYLTLGHPLSYEAVVFLGLLPVLMLLFLSWLYITSEFVRDQSETIRRLLRDSRRDKRIIQDERRKSDNLLLNILPAIVADELKETGATRPVQYDSVSVMFTDFKGFTRVAETMQPQDLIAELDRCFSFFDALTERHNLEKLKTIGDSFMCAGGLPEINASHAVDCVLAALEIQAFMNQMKELKREQGLPYWELRLGIHSGPVVAGVIGEKKFAYDVWGDTVNTASRMESSGTPGMVNVSGATWELVRDFFVGEHRGLVNAKHKGEIDMYYVTGIQSHLSRDAAGRVPNGTFQEYYGALTRS